MPDISMCNNKLCPIKELCYRYMAIPEEYQLYAKFDHHNCKYFLPIEDRPTRQIKQYK